MGSPFTIEAWTEYAVGMAILLMRIIARSSQIGFNWDGDDYFAVLAIVFFTAELIMLEMIGRYGSITGLSDEKASMLSTDQKRLIVIGSKCLLAGWVVYTTLIWCRKYFPGWILSHISQHAYTNQSRFQSKPVCYSSTND